MQSTTTYLFPALAIAALLVFAAMAKAGKTKQKLAKLGELKNIKSRLPLTPFEQRMYFALKAALPEHHVLAQVAFSALVTTSDRQTRNRFDRKVADFIICDPLLRPIAVIELDDSSHAGREAQDADRDAMLSKAGYKTVRYASIPSLDKIKEDIAGLATQSAKAM